MRHVSPIELLVLLVAALLLWHVLRPRRVRRLLAMIFGVGVVAALLVAVLRAPIEWQEHSPIGGWQFRPRLARGDQTPSGNDQRQLLLPARRWDAVATELAAGQWQEPLAAGTSAAVPAEELVPEEDAAAAALRRIAAELEASPERLARVIPGVIAVLEKIAAAWDAPAKGGGTLPAVVSSLQEAIQPTTGDANAQRIASPEEAASAQEAGREDAAPSSGRDLGEGGSASAKPSLLAVSGLGGTRPEWVGRKPFESDETGCVCWPVTVGPILVEDASSAAVRNHLRQTLSDQWAEYLAGNLGEKTSPELLTRLVAMHTAGRLSESPEGSSAWLPGRLAEELLTAVEQAVDQYVDRYIDPRAVGHLRLPVRQAAAEMVRGVWYEPWDWRGTQGQIPVSSPAPASDTAVQLHVLLAFDAGLHDLLLGQWHRWKSQVRVRRVFFGLGLVLLIIALAYTALRVDLATAGSHRSLLRWLGAVGVLVVILVGLVVLR